MPKRRHKTDCRVVVVSPSDVQDEIERLPDIEQELNETIGKVLGVHIDFVRWETDAHPGFHPEGPQGHLNGFLDIENSDAVIGVFWRRFGTPTSRSPSGTVDELERAWSACLAKGRPQVMVYFNQLEHTPQSSQELQQWQEVLSFREKFPKEGLWWPYRGAAKFEKLVRHHLTHFLMSQYGAEGEEFGSSYPSFFEAPRFSDHIARGGILDELEELVRTCPVVAVEGLSGSGKTYLVGSYLERNQASLGGRNLWYAPQKGDTLDDFLAYFERWMPLPDLPATHKCKEVLLRLREQNMLLIIDDFHQVDGQSYSPLVEAAAGHGGRPARLILISQTYVDRLRNLSNIGHLPIAGFDRTELLTFLQVRGLSISDQKMLDRLIEKTDGLPLAASLFATLALHFGRDPDDLLSDSMLSIERLHKWFEEVLSLVGPEERLLLRFLGMCDGPFNLPVVRALAAEAGIASPERAFENLQRCYLVQRHTMYRWAVHHLIAMFCEREIYEPEKKRIYLTLARHSLKGLSIGKSRVLSEEEFLRKIKACRYFHRAGEPAETPRLLSDLRKTAKARGYYDVFIQLGQETVKSGIPRDPWFDYDLAHCCLITGRLSQSRALLEPLLYTGDAMPGRRLAKVRLYAEVLAALGNPAEALDLLSETLDAVGYRVAPNVLSHARSVKTDLLFRLERWKEAEDLASALLADAERRGDLQAQAVASTRLGKIACQSSSWKQAIYRLEPAVALFQEIEDQRGLAWSLLLLALANFEQGQRRDAVLQLSKGLEIKKSINESSADYLEELFLLRKKFSLQNVAPQIDAEIRRVEAVLGGLGTGPPAQ